MRHNQTSFSLSMPYALPYISQQGENGAINACKAAAIDDMVLMFDCSKEERSRHNSGFVTQQSYYSR